MVKGRITIKMFNERFPDDKACLKFLYDRRFGDDYSCPKCSGSKFHQMNNRRCYKCDKCGFEVYPMAGTILHGSRTSLLDWFHVVRLFANSRNGVSAMFLRRELGFTMKCAMRIGHSIRTVMAEPEIILSGDVEIDATYVGGKNSKKTVIFGMVERGPDGRAKMFVVDKESKKIVLPLVLENIEKGSTIYSDEHGAYKKIFEDHGYKHKVITHKTRNWANGDIHTNSIEAFWSKFDNAVRGTYIRPSSKYMQNYIDEFSFKHNRNGDSEKIFYDLLDRLVKPVKTGNNK